MLKHHSPATVYGKKTQKTQKIAGHVLYQFVTSHMGSTCTCIHLLQKTTIVFN